WRAGRKSAPRVALPCSRAMMSCRRSFATAAVRFFSPNSRESRDMSLASEQALHEAGLFIVHETQGAILAKEARDHVGIGFGYVGALEVDRGRTLVRGVKDRFGLGYDPDQRYAQ